MSLSERIILDVQEITSNKNDFGVDIEIIQNKLKEEINEPATIEVVGFHTQHHTGFTLEGERVSSRISSIAVSEGLLVDFPVRNDIGLVDMVDYIVKVKDSTGTLKNWIVVDSYPDERVGLIVLILGEFEYLPEPDEETDVTDPEETED